MGDNVYVLLYDCTPHYTL